MTHLLLEYDESVDAAYLRASDAPWDHQERLDDARGINYAADGSIIGIEILSPRRKGVQLDGLPFPDDIARVMRAVKFRILRSDSNGSTDRDIRDDLVDAAREERLVYYGELAKKLGIPMRGRHWATQVGTVLDRIDEIEVSAGRPMLSAIVVSQRTRRPSGGFYELGQRLHLTRPGESEEEFASRQRDRTFAYWGDAPAADSTATRS